MLIPISQLLPFKMHIADGKNVLLLLSIKLASLDGIIILGCFRKIMFSRRRLLRAIACEKAIGIGLHSTSKNDTWNSARSKRCLPPGIFSCYQDLCMRCCMKAYHKVSH